MDFGATLVGISCAAYDWASDGPPSACNDRR
jgi:hypothetical protein